MGGNINSVEKAIENWITDGWNFGSKVQWNTEHLRGYLQEQELRVLDKERAFTTLFVMAPGSPIWDLSLLEGVNYNWNILSILKCFSKLHLKSAYYRKIPKDNQRCYCLALIFFLALFVYIVKVMQYEQFLKSTFVYLIL